jgi:hypothetical protein
MTHLSNKHAQQKSLQDKRVPLWTCVLALILSSIVASIVTLTLPRVSGQRPYSRLLPGLNLPPRKFYLAYGALGLYLTYTSR